MSKKSAVDGGPTSRTLYHKASQRFPLMTASIIAGVLYVIGDFLAQKAEAEEEGKGKDEFRYDKMRGTGSFVQGALVYGIIGSFWYPWVDKLVCIRMGLVRGSMPSVTAKLLIEIFPWHPTSIVLGQGIQRYFEGKTIYETYNELERDLLELYIKDVIQWLPINYINFKFTPVQHVLLVNNLFTLVDAAITSWIIHYHDRVQERERGRVGRSSVFSSLLSPLASVDKACDLNLAETHRLDVVKDGRFSVKDLRQLHLIPGVKVAEILCRKADENGDGQISKDEYIAFLTKLDETGYRHSLIADAVFAMFDTKNNGLIDRQEFPAVIKVLTGKSELSADKISQCFEELDLNQDGQISLIEFRRAVESLNADECQGKHATPPQHSFYFSSKYSFK